MNSRALEAIRDIDGYLHNALCEAVKYTELFPEDKRQKALDDIIARIVESVQEWKKQVSLVD